MASKQELEKPDAEKSTSSHLSRSMAEQLLVMMKEVTKDDKSAGAVNAACNCAKQLREILKFEFEVKKWKGQ